MVRTLSRLTLKSRFNLLFTALCVLIMAAGWSLILFNDQKAVRTELQASADLARGLLAATDAEQSSDSQHAQLLDRLRDRIDALGLIRHVRLQLLDSDGRQLGASPAPRRVQSHPPAWFRLLISPSPSTYSWPIMVNGKRLGWVLIITNPADEVAEAWTNMRAIFAMAAILPPLTWLLVVAFVGRALEPIKAMISGLDRLSSGEHGVRLPKVGVPELTRLREHFNILAERLDETTTRNEALLQRVVSVQDEERRRNARELHDNLIQYLFSIRTDTFVIERKLADGRNGAIEGLTRSIVSTANQMEQVIRNMIQRLRPLVLDELGLEDALRDLVATWRTRHVGVVYELQMGGPLNNLGSEVNLAAYQIIGECLTNIAKHAEASRVAIEIHAKRKESCGSDQQGAAFSHLKISVADNGHGIGDLSGHGVGLLGMSERVEMLKGQLSVSPRSHRGTLVEAVIPIR
jgi:two-component system sensor histidine kinase UhpB